MRTRVDSIREKVLAFETKADETEAELAGAEQELEVIGKRIVEAEQAEQEAAAIDSASAHNLVQNNSFVQLAVDQQQKDDIIAFLQ